MKQANNQDHRLKGLKDSTDFAKSKPENPCHPSNQGQSVVQTKNSGIEWLGKVPEHWKVDRIKDKTTAVVGGDWGNDPDSESEGENVVVLRVADLDDIYFKFEDLTIRKIKNGSFKSRKVDERCLIIEKSGGGEKQLVGRVGYPIGIDFDAICSNFMAKIEFDNTMDLRFANYIFSFLYSCDLNFPFVQQTTGIQNLNVTYYLNSRVAFPPLYEQKAIADYLDKACARIDRIIAIKEEQLRKIEGYFSSKMKEILSNGVFDHSEFQCTEHEWFKYIPSKWKIVRLKSVLSKINSGVTPKGGATAYLNEGIPLIRSQNVKFEKLDLSDVVFIDENTHNSMANSKVENGDVLLNITGASLGRCQYVENLKEANVNQHVCILRPFLFINTKYLYYLLRSEIGQAQIFSRFKGSGREGLNFEAIKTFRIPLPPKSEQDLIIETLDKLLEKKLSLKEKVLTQISILQSYRKSLIHECVTGKKQVFETLSTNQLIN